MYQQCEQKKKAQIKIKKIAPIAVLYKIPLGRNQASKSKFGPNLMALTVPDEVK